MNGEEGRLDRALAALAAGALGDAMGMPTQLLSPPAIAQTYGWVDRFVAPTADHPVSRGLPPGTITDDTEQALLLAAMLARDPGAVVDGGFDHGEWVRALIAWEADVRRRGSHDLLGPSTKRALEAILRGVDPAEAGRHGDTNGAAMRIAPLGILVPAAPAARVIAAVTEVSRATHGTGLAIQSAAAVAVAVSAGIDGADWPSAAEAGRTAADAAIGCGHWVAGPEIGARIGFARDLVRGRAPREGLTLVARHVGTSVASQESVPAAFAVVDLAGGDPWRAAVLAANIGGDTDTIGAIAGAMAGATTGMGALPRDRLEGLRGFDIAAAARLAGTLVAARARLEAAR